MANPPPFGRCRRVGLAMMLGAGPVAPALAETVARSDPPGISAPEESAEEGESRVLSRDVAGEPGATIPLRVEVRRGPGRSSASTYLLDLPKGARLADADHAVTADDERTIINVTDWNLSELAVTPQPQQTGTFTLAVVAMTYPENGRPMSVARSTFALRVRSEPGPAAAADRAGREVPRDDAPKPIPASLASPESDVALAEPSAPPPPERRVEPVQALVAPAPLHRAPAPGAPVPAASRPASEPAAGILIERAERLIRLGDISGARLVLERAMERGDPRAAFRLAQTCDPQVLRAWKVQGKVHGLRPDPDRARALYARAAREGLHDAAGLAEAVR